MNPFLPALRRLLTFRSAAKELDLITKDAAKAFARHQIGHPAFDSAFSGFEFDYSLESLKLVDSGLERLRSELPEKTDGTRDLTVVDGSVLMRLVFSTGSYLGEVIQQNSNKKFHWKQFEDLDDKTKTILGEEKDMSNFLLLCRRQDDGIVASPMNRIGRFLINGEEDSTYGFAISFLRTAGN